MREREEGGKWENCQRNPIAFVNFMVTQLMCDEMLKPKSSTTMKREKNSNESAWDISIYIFLSPRLFSWIIFSFGSSSSHCCCVSMFMEQGACEAHKREMTKASPVKITLLECVVWMLWVWERAIAPNLVTMRQTTEKDLFRGRLRRVCVRGRVPMVMAIHHSKKFHLRIYRSTLVHCHK